MEEPDTKEGYYYVTCVDHNRTGFLYGPFKNDHQKALDSVDVVRNVARDKVPASFWYSFGTARLPIDYENPPVGTLNKFMDFTQRSIVEMNALLKREKARNTK